MSELDYYRIFYYTAKCGSFTRAASVLNTSQPNVTRCINNLEGSLRCRLFERSGRGVKLTAAGEKLYVYVADAMEALEKGRSEIAAETSLESGTVTIGVTENALQLVLIRMLSAYHQAHPAVCVRLRSISTPESIRAVDNTTVDFALASSPYAEKSSLIITPLVTYRDCLIAGPAYINAIQSITSINQLEGQSFITLEHDSSTWQLYNSLFEQHHIEPKASVEVHTGSEILHLVRNNLGFSFYPSSIIQNSFWKDQLCIVNLKETLPLRSVVLIREAGRVLSPAARVFMEMLLKLQDSSAVS